MTDAFHTPALRRFAVFTAVSTFLLICIGGLVTSHEAGMAVPDWPNSFGYNMFFFPVSKWIGGIFYEHTHRLVASFVGLLITVLAAWIWSRESSGWIRWGGLAVFILGLGALGQRNLVTFVMLAGVGVCCGLFALVLHFRELESLCWLGMTAFFTVIVQGVLGGLRVTLYKDEIGIFHATLAQLLFLVLAALALFTTSMWRKLKPIPTLRGSALLLKFVSAGVLILLQLILGASMRHQHAGLAIPDFPLAYGRVWPALDGAAIDAYNQHRVEVNGDKPVTAFQIGLQMAHRLTAFLILTAVILCLLRSSKEVGRRHVMTRLAWGWLGLIGVQIALGAATIWTGKSADIATAHVAVGALSLVTAGILSLLAYRVSSPVMESAAADEQNAAFLRSSRVVSSLR